MSGTLSAKLGCALLIALSSGSANAASLEVDFALTTAVVETRAVGSGSFTESSLQFDVTSPQAIAAMTYDSLTVNYILPEATVIEVAPTGPTPTGLNLLFNLVFGPDPVFAGTAVLSNTSVTFLGLIGAEPVLSSATVSVRDTNDQVVGAFNYGGVGPFSFSGIQVTVDEPITLNGGDVRDLFGVEELITSRFSSGPVEPELFLTETTATVPVPPTIWLFAAVGLLGGALRLRANSASKVASRESAPCRA